MKNNQPVNQTKITIKRLACVALPLLSAIIASCASVPVAPQNMDAEAKKFSPPPGKANVYVIRSGVSGSTVAFQSTIDGVRLGGVVPRHYLMKSVSPGVHTLEAFSNENADMAQFQAVAGENYFYDAIPMMGWSTARTKLKRLDEADGKKKVLSCKRAMSMNY
ncbi:hypothetical protein N9Z15_05435 [Akkermansiaceae bacterium]|nr:hypothetical protein [Akkermansiaceae bacterium]